MSWIRNCSRPTTQLGIAEDFYVSIGNVPLAADTSILLHGAMSAKEIVLSMTLDFGGDGPKRGWESWALIGEANSCPPLSTTDPPFLHGLAARDSIHKSHDYTARLCSNWSQRAGEAGGKSYTCDPSDLEHLHPASFIASDIGMQDPFAIPLSMSPTTPHGLLQHPYATSPTSANTRGFKRAASSDGEDEHGEGDTRPSSSSRRNTAVKRACNECRQQKVSFSW